MLKNEMFVFSVFVCQSLNHCLGRVFGLPYLTLPFNILSLVVFVAMRPEFSPEPKADEDVVSKDEVDWAQVGRGIWLSMGQVKNDFKT